MRKIPALLAAVAFGLAACGGSDADSSATDGSTPEPAPTGPPVIGAKGTQWKPANVVAKVGQEVTWDVEKGLIHDLTGEDGVKHEAADEFVYTHTYDEPGTYDFVCTLHQGMNGSVKVVE